MKHSTVIAKSMFEWTKRAFLLQKLELGMGWFQACAFLLVVILFLLFSSCLPSHMVPFLLLPWLSFVCCLLVPLSCSFPSCCLGHLVPFFLVISSYCPGDVSFLLVPLVILCTWSSCSSVPVFPSSFVLSASGGRLGGWVC